MIALRIQAISAENQMELVSQPKAMVKPIGCRGHQLPAVLSPHQQELEGPADHKETVYRRIAGTIRQVPPFFEELTPS